MAVRGIATLGGHTNWSQVLSVGVRTAMLSRKVITCKTVPLSLLLNTALGWSSQQSLVQLAVGSTPVSSQNALTMGETATSHAFPFGHCHRRLCTASPTLCKVQEYTLNHSVLSTSPHTSSHVMNCPMFRTVGAGGQMSCPCTLRLHRQMATRHLASERAVPLALNVNGAMHLYQGTSSSEMPWTANCNRHVVRQVGSIVSRVSSSLPMSRRYMAHCPRLPLEPSSPPPAEDPLPLFPHHLMWWTGIC